MSTFLSNDEQLFIVFLRDTPSAYAVGSVKSRILIASLNRDSIDTPEQIERAAEQFALDISHEDLQQIIDLTRVEGSTNTAPAAIQEDH